MSKSLIFAASAVALTALASSVNAQSAFSGCDPATGLGPSGQPCVELIPLDPNRIADAPVGAAGSDRFRRLDTSTLGETFECREANAREGRGGRGVLLIEDCGAPLTVGELGQLEPFYGTTGPVASAPTPIPASAPTVVVPSPAASVPAAAGSALPPVGQIAGTTLAGTQTGFVPLLAAAAPFIAGAAGVAGIAAAAAAGGGSSTPSTN